MSLSSCEELLQNSTPLEVLKESERKYRTLFEAATDGVLLMRKQVLDCNPKLCEIWGASREQIIGSTPMDFSPETQPDGRLSKDASAEYVSKAVQGEVVTFYWQHKTASGVLIDAVVSLRTVMIGGRRTLQATVRDITEQIQVAHKLQESETRFRQLFSSMSLGMAIREVIVDKDGRPVDYRLLDVNPSYEAMTGVKRENVIGKTHSELNGGRPSSWVAEYGMVGVDGVPRKGEFSSPTEDKHYEVYAYSPKPRQVATLVADVTETKKNRQLIARRSEMLRKLSEYSAQYLEMDFASVDYMAMASHLLDLARASYTVINIYNDEGTLATTVGLAYADPTLTNLDRVFGVPLLGGTWRITDEARVAYAEGMISRIKGVSDIAFGQLPERVCSLVEKMMGIGQVYGMGLVHKGVAVGNLVLIMPQGQDAECPELIEVYGRAVASLLLRQKTEQALRLSEARYRQLIEDSPSAILHCTLDGTIVMANQQMALMFGYGASQELLGTSILSLVAERELPKLRHSLANLPDKVVERNVERVWLRRDGSEFVGEVSSGVIFGAEGKPIAIQVICQDITERKMAEARANYMAVHDQLTGLYNRPYFEAELSRLEGGRDYPVGIVLIDVDGLKFINDTFGCRKGDEIIKTIGALLKGALRRGDLLARLGGDEFGIVLPRTASLETEEIVRRLQSAVETYNSSSTLPISLSMGLATAPNSSITLSQTFRDAEDMMYRDKLYRKSSIRSQTVNALLAALAERDHIADGHASRMQELCRQLGEWAGLSSSQLTDLALFAQVHDLGKVGIPDHILFKDGPLSDEEWKVMRQHPEKGYRIASTSPALSSVADLILRHHERWDGKGYPLGISKEEIPVECRILSIVDAFDAMTNDRPYRKALPLEAAKEEILKCAGLQFDPRLVEGFLEILKCQ